MHALSATAVEADGLVVRTIERAGLPLHFLHVPGPDAAAPIALLSHGFPGNSFDWLDQLAVLRGRCEVVAPFMHGTYDGRKVPRSRLQSESLQADIDTVLRSVDPQGSRPLILIGHDLGCFLNTTLTERYGARIRGLVNINGLGLHQFYARLFGPSQWLKSYYVLLLQFAPIRRLVADILPGPVLRLVYRLCGVQRDDALYAHDKRVMTSIYIYKVLMRRVRECGRRPIRKIVAPTVFIWGNRDAFLDIPRRPEVERFYENAEIRIVRGGHWVTRSNKDHVNQILASALARWTTTGEASDAPV